MIQLIALLVIAIIALSGLGLILSTVPDILNFIRSPKGKTRQLLRGILIGFASGFFLVIVRYLVVLAVPRSSLILGDPGQTSDNLSIGLMLGALYGLSCIVAVPRLRNRNEVSAPTRPLKIANCLYSMMLLGAVVTASVSVADAMYELGYGEPVPGKLLLDWGKYYWLGECLPLGAFYGVISLPVGAVIGWHCTRRER